MKQLINEKTVARKNKKVSMIRMAIDRKYGEKGSDIKISITRVNPLKKFSNVANRIKTREMLCMLISLKR